MENTDTQETQCRICWYIKERQKGLNKMKELTIQDALEYTKSIINAVRAPLIILYDDLTVALANRSFYQAFKVKPEDTEKQQTYL
jgi:hypothetical protein